MKKLILLMLLCGASAKSMGNDSLSLFESGTYTVGNIKKFVNWGVRTGFQGAKMYLGKNLFMQQAWNQVQYDANGRPVTDVMAYPRFAVYKGGGALLFLHGLKGFLKECGYNSPGELFKYLEGRE